jgi:hypothetical protein
MPFLGLNVHYYVERQEMRTITICTRSAVLEIITLGCASELVSRGERVGGEEKGENEGSLPRFQVKIGGGSSGLIGRHVYNSVKSINLRFGGLEPYTSPSLSVSIVPSHSFPFNLGSTVLPSCLISVLKLRFSCIELCR